MLPVAVSAAKAEIDTQPKTKQRHKRVAKIFLIAFIFNTPLQFIFLKL